MITKPVHGQKYWTILPTTESLSYDFHCQPAKPWLAIYCQGRWDWYGWLRAVGESYPAGDEDANASTCIDQNDFQFVFDDFTECQATYIQEMLGYIGRKQWEVNQLVEELEKYKVDNGKTS